MNLTSKSIGVGIVLLGLILGACSAPAPKGSLRIEVGGLPTGTPAQVTVREPGGSSRTLTATQTLNDLTPGSYTVEAADVQVGAVNYKAQIEGSPAQVEAGKTASVRVTYSSNLGTLRINLTGLPDGVTARVRLEGPNGFGQTVSGASSLNLPAGTYRITPGAAFQPGTHTDTVYDGQASPPSVSVTAGETQEVSVVYAARPGSGHLWVSVADPLNRLDAYSNTEISAQTPSSFGLASPVFTRPLHMAFDTQGNLYVGDTARDRIYKFARTDLGAGGENSPVNRDPILTLSLSVGDLPWGMAFDREGHLWVVLNRTAGLEQGQVVRYARADLEANNSSATPQPVITGLTGPAGINFDSDGKVWVVEAEGNRIARYNPADGSRELSLTGLTQPLFAVFDRDGNLWTAEEFANRIVRIDRANLVDGPAVVGKDFTDASIQIPIGMTLDNGGKLWLATRGTAQTNGGRLLRFDPSRCPGAGCLEGSYDYMGQLGGIALSPPPAGLPFATRP